MQENWSEATISFSDDALAAITAALPCTTPPERRAALPELLRIWVEEELPEHLSREDRAAFKQHKMLRSRVVKRARELLAAVAALDKRVGSLWLAQRPEMRRATRTGTVNPQWAKLGLAAHPAAGEQR